LASAHKIKKKIKTKSRQVFVANVVDATDLRKKKWELERQWLCVFSPAVCDIRVICDK
jgi:hypothetical protein